MFQLDNALIYLGVTILTVAGVQPVVGVPMLYVYIFVALFGSGLAVGIRWWRGHLTTIVSRIIAFVAGLFGSGLASTFAIGRFNMVGLELLLIIGLSAMGSARAIVFWVAVLDVEKLGRAAQARAVNTIDPKNKGGEP